VPGKGTIIIVGNIAGTFDKSKKKSGKIRGALRLESEG
jgi:hypothetical protein